MTACLLCGGFASEVHSKYTGYKEPDTFSIYSCSDCGVHYSWPRVDASELYDVIYSQGEAHPGYDRYWRYARQVKIDNDPLKYLESVEPTYFGVAEFLRTRGVPRDAKILEVGCGLGYLTYSLRRAGYLATGIDISRVVIDRATETFGEFYLHADLMGHAADYEAKYDVVIATELIEHVESPVDYISAMLRLVRDGGYVVLTTPNKTFFPAGMVWESSLPPIHCWWFSEDSMRYFAKLFEVGIEFVNFKKYFRNQKMKWSIQACVEAPPPSAILDSDNTIIKEAMATAVAKPTFFSKMKAAIRNIPLADMAIRYFRAEGPALVAGDRCHYMCVVFKKGDKGVG